MDFVLPPKKVPTDDYYVELTIKRSPVWSYLARRDASTGDVMVIPGHTVQ